MNYEVVWLLNSEISYYEETDFILRKWNKNEVGKFQELVYKNIEIILINPEIGVYNEELDIHYVVISKQTTLYYSFSTKEKIIELHLFWNNLKNPKDLIKLL